MSEGELGLSGRKNENGCEENGKVCGLSSYRQQLKAAPSLLRGDDRGRDER